MKSKKSQASHRTRSRAASRASARPSTSRPGSLERVHSAQAFDDHSTYHHRDSDDFTATEVEQDGESKPSRKHDTVRDRNRDVISEKDGHTSYESSEEHEKVEEEEEKEEAEEEVETEEEVEGSKGIREGNPEEQDVELGKEANIDRVPSNKSSIRDPYLVDWNGPDDPEFPKNWSMKQRWAATFIVSCFTFISPVSSSITAPALGSMARDLHITSNIELSLTFSIFVLAYALGPLFLGPMSEIFGRVRVLQLGNLFYLAWNIGCGFATTKTQMIIFRFLAGIGGSTPQSVGGGVLSDTWKPEDRGKAISIYSLAPLLGPAVGPICGGFIAEYSTWRWAFWSTSIATVIIQAFGFIFLQETYTPVLLKRKAAKLRKETGDNRYYTKYDDDGKSLLSVIGTAVKRPFILLGTQPIIQVISLYMAYLYGLMYLIISTFPTLWTEVYHESVSIGGLNYISMGLGFLVSTQISSRLIDIIYRRLKKQNNGVGKPEFRIPLMYYAAFVVPISLFWYGWSAQARIHWIMPNIGIFLFSASAIIGFQCMQSYIIDSYTRYAASGIAAAVVLRALAGFGFPLFAPYMYGALGNGWGNSLLAFIAIAIGIPAPFLFARYGETLRKRSPFASGGEGTK